MSSPDYIDPVAGAARERGGSSGGSGPLKVARAAYDFAVHGGAIGAIALGDVIPAGAVILHARIDVIEPVTAADLAATAGIGIEDQINGDLLYARPFGNVGTYTFDCSLSSGGGVGLIALGNNPVNADALIVSGTIEVVTPLVGGAGATVSIDSLGEGDIEATSLATDARWTTVGSRSPSQLPAHPVRAKTGWPGIALHVSVADLTAGLFHMSLNYLDGGGEWDKVAEVDLVAQIKTTAARRATLVISGAPLTAGKFVLYLEYVEPS